MENTTIYDYQFTINNFQRMDCSEYFSYYNVRFATVFVLQPIIYAFGMPGNTIALIIWLLPHMRRSTSGYYFSSLAIADECVLLCHLIFNIQQAYGHGGLLENDGVCKFFNIIFITAQCCSTFIGLAMTVERFFVVKHPMKVHKLFEKHKILKVILIIFGTSLTVGLLLGLLWNYRFDEDTRSCVVLGISRRDTGSPVLNTVTILIIIFGIICPIGVILGLNIIIIHGLVQMRRDRENNILRLTQATLSKQKRETNKTIIILCVGLYMVAARTPDIVTYLLQPFYPPGSATLTCEQRTEDKTWNKYYDYLSAAAVINTFALTSYAFNILIYSLAGRRFRRTGKIAVFKVLSKCKLVSEPDEEWTSSEITPFRGDRRRSSDPNANNRLTVATNRTTLSRQSTKKAATTDFVELKDMPRESLAKTESEA